jgi:CO/xanthine dehydrogenase Mo-binding subunit
MSVWDQVHMVSASTLEGPDEGMTSSSISVQDSGSAIRHACAEVRFLALQQAAHHHGLPADTLRIEQGRFTDAQGRSLGDYWDWLKNIRLDREYEGLAQPKPVDALKMHGHGKVRRRLARAGPSPVASSRSPDSRGRRRDVRGANAFRAT